jgi:predicted helicase
VPSSPSSIPSTTSSSSAVNVGISPDKAADLRMKHLVTTPVFTAAHGRYSH